MNKESTLLERQREQLLSMISDYSEETWCAGWMSDIEQTIAIEGDGSVFAILGKALGWPIGYRAEGGWETWEQAVYRAHKRRTEYLPKSIAHIDDHPENPLFPDRPQTSEHLVSLLEESKRMVAKYEAALADVEQS